MPEPILLPEPEVIPAVAERVLTGLFVKTLIVNVDDWFDGRITLKYQPFCVDTLEIASGPLKTISLPYWKAYDEVPEVKTAIHAVLNAVRAMHAKEEELRLAAEAAANPSSPAPADSPAPPESSFVDPV